jgi:malonyl-CoA/methylmalonyl-CoA synthetase
VVVADEAAWGRADHQAWGIDALAQAASARAVTPIDTALDAASPAALVYTSGTTGPAKGAVITHGNLCANARMLVDAWRFTAADRLLLALPLFHVHGLGNGVHCWLLSGCRTRLLERFDHASAAATLRDFRPTVFFGVPTMYVRLLEVRKGGGTRDRGRVQALRLGIGAASGAGAGGLRGALRSPHPRALRHDRDVDDARQPV